MPLFTYSVVAADGKQRVQEIWADSLEGAKELLMRENVWFYALQEQKAVKKRKFTLENKLLFFQDLAQLLQAGIVLFEAIVLIEEKMEKSRFASLFSAIKESMRRGKNFSQALRETGVFDPITIGMLEMGESSGRMLDVVQEIVVIMKKQSWLRKEILSAVSYPAFLLCLGTVVFVVLLCFLVPAMQDLFQDRQLPWLTRMVIALSSMFLQYWPVFVFGIFSSIVFFHWVWKQERFIARRQKVLEHLPIVSTLIRDLEMARFSRTLYALVLAHVPLVDSLRLTLEVTKNKSFRQAVETAEERICRGASLHEAFQGQKMIPPIFCRLLETAEKSGALEPVLAQAAELYEQRIDTSLKQGVAILQPALILLIGLMIGLIMLATLVPMTDISSFMEGI